MQQFKRKGRDTLIMIEPDIQACRKRSGDMLGAGDRRKGGRNNELWEQRVDGVGVLMEVGGKVGVVVRRQDD